MTRNLQLSSYGMYIAQGKAPIFGSVCYNIDKFCRVIRRDFLV